MLCISSIGRNCSFTWFCSSCVALQKDDNLEPCYVDILQITHNFLEKHYASVNLIFLGFDIWQEFEYPPQAANSHHTYCGELPSLELKTCWTRIFNLSLLFCLTQKHCLKFIANSVTFNTIIKLSPKVIDTIFFINDIQVPCILGVNLSDVDLMEFLQQVIHIYNTASFSTSFSLSFCVGGFPR